MRYLLTVVLAFSLAGCGTSQPLTTSGYDFSAHGHRVFVRPVELTLGQEQFGEIDLVPRPDWVSKATPLLQEAIAVELVRHGAQVVTDPEAEADYVLTVTLDDNFDSPGSVAAKTTFVLALVALAIVAGPAPGLEPWGSMSPPSSATATLEIQGTHDIVWQIAYTSGFPDVRTQEGATAFSAFLLEELPWPK